MDSKAANSEQKVVEELDRKIVKVQYDQKIDQKIDEKTLLTLARKIRKNYDYDTPAFSGAN